MSVRDYAASGIGATYAWVGKKAGVGDMLITKSDPKSGIVLDLNFTKSMKAKNKTEITLIPDGSGIRINWRCTARNHLLAA